MAELSAETCTNKDLFGVVTSGLKYMCVDQSIGNCCPSDTTSFASSSSRMSKDNLAFNGTIRCIDHYASRVQMGMWRKSNSLLTSSIRMRGQMQTQAQDDAVRDARWPHGSVSGPPKG